MKVKTIFIMLIICPFFLFGQKWDYPIKPGTEEWKKMDYKEKVKLSQPKQEMLEKIPIHQLMSYCLDYPFNKDILLFNNPNEGFKIVFESSTVWQEFIKRKGAGKVFVDFYQKHMLGDLFKISDINTRNHELFNQYFLEKLASETSFVTQLNTSEKESLMLAILDRYETKKNYPDEYLGFAYNSSLSVMLKILESEKIRIESLSNFKEVTHGERFVNSDLENNIVKSAREYLKK
jgi:hypothetical protein